MTVSQNNTRINIKMTKKEYEYLQLQGKRENRSISSIVGALITKYVNDCKLGDDEINAEE